MDVSPALSALSAASPQPAGLGRTDKPTLPPGGHEVGHSEEERLVGVMAEVALKKTIILPRSWAIYQLRLPYRDFR